MSKPVVLIIEDEPDVLKMLSCVLRHQNVEITEALGGTQALVILENTTPDIILLDLAMPGINGLDILENIQQQPRLHNASIFVLTARPQMAQQVCQNYSVEKIFLKPIQPVALLQAIKPYL
ncbi:response regulator [Chloroflexota bacterium]